MSSCLVHQTLNIIFKATLHLEAIPIWWYDFFELKNVCYDTPELVESGAPKMDGQFFA
jgi:hypothetical protein